MISQHTKALRKNGSVKMNHYYACGNYLSKGIASCKPNYVRADDIEEWFFSQLQILVNTPQITQRITTSIQAKQASISTPMQEQVRLFEDELNAHEAERKRLFRAFEDGTLPKDELKARIGEIQTRSLDLQAKKDDVERQIRASKTETTDTAQIHSALRQLRAVLQSANEDQQKRFLRGFIEKIILPADRSIEKARVWGTGPFDHYVLREEWRA